jgi:hypothetical protein
MSLAALEALIAGVKVRCEVVERSGIVAKVFSPNGVDIGRRLVPAGMAYRRYSKDYLDAEKEACKVRRGMWRGTFVRSWRWRASSPPRARHPVSGNVRPNRSGTHQGFGDHRRRAAPITSDSPNASQPQVESNRASPIESDLKVDLVVGL